MEEMISYCGLICTECPIYIASREPDKNKKEKLIVEIIDACRNIYGIEYKPEQITECDGCKSNSGRIFSSCRECKIKKCASEKNIESCALCRDYPCGQLLKIFETEPAAKQRLDNIRKNFRMN